MIGVIDYGMGNILSVQHALLSLGEDARVCVSPQEIAAAECLVLPGVGAFCDGMRNLRERGFVEALTRRVVQERIPILGICLGMQLMATRGFEGGENEGLGWIDADVVKFDLAKEFRVPHVGWDDIIVRPECTLFDGLPMSPDVYFDHSFHVRCREEADTIAWCDYGGKFSAALQKGTIVAMQFHPEKSQDYGLRILENFVRRKPC